MKPFNSLTRRQKTACIITGLMVVIAAAALAWTMLARKSQVVVNTNAVLTVTEPETAAPLAPIGDSRADRVYSTAIYYLDNATGCLKAVMRDVTVGSDTTLFEVVVDAVMSKPDESRLETPGESDIQVLSVEVSRGIATVDLSIDARQLDSERMHTLRAALTNSLIDTGYISQVNVLIDGSEECILQLPAGTMSFFDCDMNAVWQAAVDEDAHINGGETLTRNVTLYFGALSGEYILPEVHSISVSDGDYLGAVLDEILSGPDDTATCARIMPSSSQYLRETPEIITSSDGCKIAMISFNGAITGYFEKNGISTAMAFGSLVRSICGFVPNVDGVLLDIDGIVVTELYDSQKRLMYTFTDGIMRRGDFDSMVGEIATLYYPTADGTALKKVHTAIPRYDADNPRALVKMLMQNPYDATISRATPEVVTDADVLGIRVENGQVLINLSGAFYQACQGLSAGSARTMVYSIVNTMCSLDGISSVRFYFDGERVDSLASVISMRGSLMFNSGIVQKN